MQIGVNGHAADELLKFAQCGLHVIAVVEQTRLYDLHHVSAVLAVDYCHQSTARWIVCCKHRHACSSQQVKGYTVHCSKDHNHVPIKLAPDAENIRLLGLET